MARDLRSSNVNDLEVRIAADGSELIPCEFNGRDVYLTAALIAAINTGSGLPPQWTDGGNGNVTATVDVITKTAFTIEAIAGQTALGFKYYDKDGNLSVDIDEIGTLDAKHIAVQDPPDTGTDVSTVLLPGRIVVGANTDPSIQVLGSGASPFPGALLFQVLNPGDGAVMSFALHDPTDAALEVGAALAQSAPLAIFWDYPFNVRQFIIGPTGAIGTSAGEPADADINAGECFFGFDPTNGASKVLFKGKSANGTVVSGNLPLA